MPARHVSASFRDSKGQTARVNYYLSDDTAQLLSDSQNAVQSALAAVTIAHVYASNINGIAEPVVYGGTSDGYPDVEDKLALVFQTGSGAFHRYQVPCPKFSVLLADGETPDAGNVDLSSLIAAMIAHVTSRDGAPLTQYVGGFRRRSRFQRRFNVIMKNPNLTGEGE